MTKWKAASKIYVMPAPLETEEWIHEIRKQKKRSYIFIIHS